MVQETLGCPSHGRLRALGRFSGPGKEGGLDRAKVTDVVPFQGSEELHAGLRHGGPCLSSHSVGQGSKCRGPRWKRRRGRREPHGAQAVRVDALFDPPVNLCSQERGRIARVGRDEPPGGIHVVQHVPCDTRDARAQAAESVGQRGPPPRHGAEQGDRETRRSESTARRDPRALWATARRR